MMGGIESEADNPGAGEARFRLLEPGEGARLSAAIRVAYGETYDLPWVYDTAGVDARITAGTYTSCVAETPAGELLCHVGLSRHDPEDQVGHSGQAVTMPVARGQHLFTATKRFLLDWARSAGMAGMYSEATAAHPYSERAIVASGGHETGFLLGWIPGSVANDAAQGPPRRQSAALFYTKTNDGHERPVFAPPRHCGIVAQTLEICELRGELSEPPAGLRLDPGTSFNTEVRDDHGLAILTIARPGADLDEAISAERERLFGDGLAAVYVDLPLEDPATALVAEHLEELGVSYSGVFPNSRADADVLRMQSLNGVTVTAGDVAVGSDHGRELLEYVLADLGG